MLWSNSSKGAQPFLRPELRKNKEIEHFGDAGKSGNALEQAAQPCAYSS
jgi:hypothetical protein